MKEALQPENVAIVVNGESWASRAVAEAYVGLRGIPSNQVIVLRGLPHFEMVDVEVFRKQILTPVFAAIEDRGLKEAIDCIAYSADIPYEINFHADLGANGVNPHAGDRAALTGLTYLHEAVTARQARVYTALDSNRYARRANTGRSEKPLSDEEVEAWRAASRLAHEKKQKEAVEALTAFCKRYPGRAFAYYDLACVLAVGGDTNAAMTTLTQAVDAGWWNTSHTDNDSDLMAVRTMPAYAVLRERMEEVHRRISIQDGCRFRSRTAWDAAGMPTTGADGRHYMLSVMLGVTSGRGMSVRETISALERAAAADGTRPAGTVYYMVNDDVRSRTRKWGFDAAVRLLKAEGVAAEIVKGSLPTGKADIAGLMAGIADFDFKASGNRVLPGAICEHLTSCGGILTWPGGQTALTEFIRHGAAGASGTVTEPYAIQAKFPDPFIHVHYVRGASLAEAFYLSVAGPYQLLIVGDPLCRPWGKARKAKGKLARKEIQGGPVLAGVPTLQSLAGGGSIGETARAEGAVPSLDPSSLRRGFRVAVGRQDQVIGGGNGVQPWWKGLNLATGAEVCVEGFIQAVTNDLFQFQILNATQVEVSVDGQALSGSGDGSWRMFPVRLETGWHAVKVSLGADRRAKDPAWDLRFGAAGVSPLTPQLQYCPRAGEAVRLVGLSGRVSVDEMTDDPLSARMKFAVDGLQAGRDAAITMAWEAPEGGGWSVEPARAEAPVVKGQCEPVPFRVQYQGAPFGTDTFFRLPACKVEVKTKLGIESADPISLPLERLLKERPRPEVAAPHLEQPPKIDGQLDDKAWAGAATIARFVRPQLDRPAGPATTAWLAWDERGLYLAARCMEPDLKAMRLAARQRDGATYEDDSIEFFVAADAAAKTYYQIVVNAAGVVYDGRGWDGSWNGEHESATGREDGAWTIEIAVPWTTLGAEKPGPGAVLRVLMARNRRVEKGAEQTMWPVVPGGNHQPPLFGRVVLAK